MNRPTRLVSAIILAAALAGCSKKGELVIEEGVGISAVLSSCPTVGIPDYTGDVTTFRSIGDVTAANLDVVASITNMRSTCDESGTKVYSNATFDVVARRADVRGARQVTLPYFVTVLRGGSAVVTKRVGQVTLPPEVREKISRKRKPGDVDAALDPLADTEVRAAILRTSFEMLIGFQLTQDQLAYNATR